MTILTDGFRYARPSTLDEALVLMGEPGAMVLAGGQTLIPRLTSGVAAPKVLVDVSGLSGLKLIQEIGLDLAIGSMVTLAEVIQSATLEKRCPLLPQGAAKTATPSVRNRGTLVGNLAWADPASQLPASAWLRLMNFSRRPMSPRSLTVRWSPTCTSKRFQGERVPAWRTWRRGATPVHWQRRRRS
jgi:CO/xanthine dehydrogenase FAD-binding subunit